MDRKSVSCTICGILVGATGVCLIKKGLKSFKKITKTSGKLRGVENWVRINHLDLTKFSVEILKSIGCDEITARIVGEHLVGSNLQSIDSHGVVRLEQYVDQAKKGLFTPSGFPKVTKTERGAWMVDGNGGFGITALKIGVDKVIAHYI